MFGFETNPSHQQITVWHDSGNGETRFRRLVLQISKFQQLLRDGEMVDSGTIRWIAEGIPLMGALRLRNAGIVLDLLKPSKVEPHVEDPGTWG